VPDFEYYDEQERELVEQYVVALRGLTAAVIEYPSDRAGHQHPAVDRHDAKANDTWADLVRYYQEKYTCEHAPRRK
jgi:hypothetical protein